MLRIAARPPSRRACVVDWRLASRAAVDFGHRWAPSLLVRIGGGRLSVASGFPPDSVSFDGGAVWRWFSFRRGLVRETSPKVRPRFRRSRAVSSCPSPRSQNDVRRSVCTFETGAFPANASHVAPRRRRPISGSAAAFNPLLAAAASSSYHPGRVHAAKIPRKRKSTWGDDLQIHHRGTACTGVALDFAACLVFRTLLFADEVHRRRGGRSCFLRHGATDRFAGGRPNRGHDAGPPFSATMNELFTIAHVHRERARRNRPGPRTLARFPRSRFECPAGNG